MADGIELDPTRFNAAMETLGALTTREIKVEMFAQARGIIIEAYGIIPPATGRTRGEKVSDFDNAAQLRGEKKIDRDLRGIFAPVVLRGERRIDHLFGDTDPDVRKKPPYVVKTTERHPDIKQIYDTRDARRRGSRLSRGQRSAYYVDARKLEDLARTLKSRVGFAAAGFNAAAQALKARIPKYAKGKASPGSIQITANERRIRIVFTNDVEFIDNIPDIKRKLQYALDLQAAKIERQIPHILAKAGKLSGFKVAA